MNPWFLEIMVEYERDRMRRDLKQIRLEKEAMRARRTEEKTMKASLDRPHLIMRIMPSFIKGLFCVGR